MTQKRIAILRRNGLGDFIAATVPLIKFLLLEHKNTEIYLFMSKANCGLVKYFFDESIDNIKIVTFPSCNKYFSAINIALKYRKENFDIGIVPLPDYPKLSGLFLLLLDSKDNYGRQDKSCFSKMAINHNFEGDVNFQQPIALYNIQFYDQTVKKLDKKFYPKIKKELLPIYKPKKEGPYILVELSNNRIDSQLKIDIIAGILNKLYKDKKFSVLISAKIQDSSKVGLLSSMLYMEYEAYLTNNMDAFISFLNAADVILTGDGGLGHIAGALDKSVIALYARTNPIYWGILGEKVDCLYDDNNVNNISDDKIISALKKVLV